MKILAAGDVHGDTTLSENLAKMAKDANVDLVVLCGDLTDFDSSTENIIGPFKKLNQKVLIIPGNHESNATADFLAEAYTIKNIHGYAVKYGDVGIFGCSGVNIGINAIPEKEIFNYFKTGHDRISYAKKKLMVSHVHPSNSLMEKMSNIVPGSTGVRQAIDEFSPDIMICSHVHEASGIEEKIGNTRVINVGSKGKIIDL